MSNQKTVTPYGGQPEEKKKEVAEMFDNIAPKYDFLNHLLSMGIDKLWRRKVVKIIRSHQPKHILDVATGTGDLAIALMNAGPEKITGIDISAEMLEVAGKKVASARLENKISLQLGDSEKINFPDDSFDAVTVAFGVRNYENLKRGLSEMHRVLMPKAPLVILEFSKPKNRFFRWIYFFYFRNVLPLIGKLVSKDSRAYTYLPESVEAFPDGADFIDILKETGFNTVKSTPLTFGIATIYTAVK